MKLDKFRLFRVRPYTTKKNEYKLQLIDMFFKKTISTPIIVGETWTDFAEQILKEQGFKIVGVSEVRNQSLIYICKDTHLFLKNVYEKDGITI